MNLKKNIVLFSIVVSPIITFSNEISIESIVRKPEVEDVSLSLDGKYAAALYTDTSDQQQLLTYNIDTKEKKIYKPTQGLDVYRYYWASNDHLVYYVSQQDGRYLCYLSTVDRDLSIKSRRILLGAYIQSDVVAGLLNDPDNILIKKKYSSQYSIVGKMNIHKGWIRKKEKFRAEILWEMTDFNGLFRLVSLYDYKNKGGKSDHLYRNSSEASWKKISLCEEDDVYSFTPDGKGLYIGTYKNPMNNYTCDEPAFNKALQDAGKEKRQNTIQKTKSLYTYDIEKNKVQQTLFYDSVFDFQGDLHFFSNPYNPSGNSLKGITQWNDTVVSYWYDKKIEKVQQKLDSCFPHSVNYIYDADTSLNRFLFNSYSDIKECEYYLYDVKTDKITLLFKSCPWLKPEVMCKTKPVTFQARDSLTLHGYLTLPNTGKPPYPTVILSHGGPHARDYWGIDAEVQVLASRGYAVFQINYRGSTGFGYIISEKEKFNFHKMYLDIIDGTNFIINEGIADKKRIAVMGASFGGYLTICGIAFEPDLYCCAISNVGVFDWKKQLRTERFEYNSYVYDYYAPYLGGGDNKKYLDSISPIHKVKKIKVPVFLAGGDEDTRVSSLQSYDLSGKLKAAGVHVETYFKAYERHGFQRQKSITEYYKRVLDFLSRNMGEKK